MMKKMFSTITALLLLAGCSAQNTADTADTSDFIGEERAREIALEQAGIGSEGVRFDRTELEFDNGVWEYEIEFRQGENEYSADIKADDGTVINWDADIRD